MRDSITGANSKARMTAIIIGLLVVAFLVGFLPQWMRVRSLQRELSAASQQIVVLDMGGRLAAALAEAQRGNYERARQLMADFFTDLERETAMAGEAGQKREFSAIMSERDEIITQLSRAEPESTSRLNLMYTRYFAAAHPAGLRAPAAVSPSPPATAPTTPP